MLEFHVSLEGRGDLARRIHRRLRQAILDGQLRRGDRLPATRALARRLGVSRNTVCLAYEWLVAEGLLSGHRGAGSFVDADQISRPLPRAPATSRARSIWKEVAIPTPRPPTPYDFSVGTPDATLFPFDTWRRLLARQLRGSKLSGGYGDPAGHPRLRAAIARHVALSRGVNARPEDVLVTNGAQGAFDLIARVLLEPGQLVATEEPGYPPPRLLFQSYGARVAAVPVDSAGLDVAGLPDGARLVYVTPSHQFPLGVAMSHARKIALLEWAERRNAVIVEDDYDSEFRFGGRPVETLHAIDRSGRVVYVGTFSKCLLPGLRLGFLVAPPCLQAALRAASYLASWHAHWPAQAALASLIDTNLLARHIGRMRREYAARHELILRVLEQDFSEWLSPVPSLTGMHLAARLVLGGLRLESELTRQARLRGLAFERLSAYCTAEKPQAGVVLGYGAIERAKIERGLRRLRQCFVSAARP